MRFCTSLALTFIAIAAPALSASVFIPGDGAPLGSQWHSLPIPSDVKHLPNKSDPKDCSLNVTVVTSKCAGGPYRWGSIFQPYDKLSQNSWNVSYSVKASDGDLYSKYNFVAQCGTNGRFLPTDQTDNMKKISAQGVRFFAGKDYSAAWVETTPKDDETGEPRNVLAPVRLYHFSDTPTKIRNTVDYSKNNFGWDNSRIVTTQKEAILYIEMCK